MNKFFLYIIICAVLPLFGGCESSSEIHTLAIGTRDSAIREYSVSSDGIHQIASIVTRNRGIGIAIDGTENYFDDFSIRYSPVIDDNGHYAWIQETKGRGYDVIWQGRSILKSANSVDFLTASCTKAIFVESNLGHFQTRLFIIDMSSGDCESIKAWQSEYIEDVCRYGVDLFGVLTCTIDNSGIKRYNLYKVDGKTASVELIIERELSLTAFPINATQPAPSSLTWDYIQLTDNDRYLYNAIKLFWGGQDAFAYGNDFRGRLSWDESERLRGLCELYKKTNSTIVKRRIDEVVEAIMFGRNSFITDFVADEWNTGYLWSSKCYSIGYAPICTMVENCEILSALLYACNEGIAANRSEIIENAKRAYDYYDGWYKDGHYYIPKGMPYITDGLVVPWNHQNSLAEVALGLYIETGGQHYLTRCEDIIKSFKEEWEVESDRIYWHYWPMEIYQGWDDGRSVNQPTSSPSEDRLYEDASHAGISVRLLCRYSNVVKNGVVSNEEMKKIETNMTYFCHTDGFSRFISGDEEYNPKAWHYWVSPYFSYLHDNEFEKYVRNGYLRCFPLWDSQEALFAYAKLYKPELKCNRIHIERKELDSSEQQTTKDSFNLSNDDLFNYMGIEN